MWLQKNLIHLLESEGFGLIPHRLQEGAQTQISGDPQDTFGRTYDQIEGVLGKVFSFQCVFSHL